MFSPACPSRHALAVMRRCAIAKPRRRVVVTAGTLALLLTLSATSGAPSGNAAAPRSASTEMLRTLAVAAPSYTFADEFTGAAGTRPTGKWSYQTGGGGWGNGEVQQYTDRAANAQLDGAGNLAITARHETFTGSDGITRNYTSARLYSTNTVKFGYVEARLKMPQGGQGLWPAFWMLGSDIWTKGWPICGELDVVEAINKLPTAYGTAHGPDYAKSSAYKYGGASSPAGGLANTWHTYALSSTSTSITWYLDGVAYRTLNSSSLTPGQAWVFNQPQYLLLDIAVGGVWTGPPDATTPSTATMLVDWVHAGGGLPPDIR
jgi:beta-glucanase (GH16 family)